MTTRNPSPRRDASGTAATAGALGVLGVAVCSTLAPGSADAMAVVVDIPDVTLGTYQLDVDSNGTVDFGFQRSPLGSPLSGYENTLDTYTNAVVGHTVAPGGTTKAGTYADRLAAGEVVDASRQFVSSDHVILSGAKDGLVTWGEFFDHSGVGYVGLKFQGGDAGTHYGWAEATAHAE